MSVALEDKEEPLELWVEGPSSILTGSSEHTEGDKSITAVKRLAMYLWLLQGQPLLQCAKRN